ncbi:MAG: C-GCAxxG-C-C family protein [Ignavibacteriales bacterium]|nr:C-GCAxxG-C-C family protein [Ignavibacteriales bacterium]
MKSRVDDATDRFKRGFNCAQAVFSAYAPLLGIEEADALRISTGFGAGMGRQQEVCGAVTGALMVIGSKHGMSDASDVSAKERTYAEFREFTRCFHQLHGSISRRELLGCDINTEEGKKDYAERRLSATVCLPCVQNACKLLEESGVLEQDSRWKP